ncbi:MAG: LysR family transcriptional regulator [Stappiaceae bacterium]
MKPNPTDMLMFLEVVDARSFTAAAERLGRTKSALSQAVARLEEDVGSRLLHRSTRSLALTETGAAMLGHCRDIRQVYKAVQTDLNAVDKKPAGTLTMTAPHALCTSVLSPAVADFAAQHPDMSFRLVADDAPVDLIERQVDLAVRVGTPGQQTARLSKIGTLSEGLYASHALIETKDMPPANIEALENWDHIANEWQGTPITYSDPMGPSLRVTPRFRCNTVQDVLRLTMEGAGVARLPDIMIPDQGSDGKLTCLFPLDSTPIYVVHQFANRPPPKVTHFIKFLRKNLRSSRIGLKA